MELKRRKKTGGRLARVPGERAFPVSFGLVHSELSRFEGEMDRLGINRSELFRLMMGKYFLARAYEEATDGKEKQSR